MTSQMSPGLAASLGRLTERVRKLERSRGGFRASRDLQPFTATFNHTARQVNISGFFPPPIDPPPSYNPDAYSFPQLTWNATWVLDNTADDEWNVNLYNFAPVSIDMYATMHIYRLDTGADEIVVAASDTMLKFPDGPSGGGNPLSWAHGAGDTLSGFTNPLTPSLLNTAPHLMTLTIQATAP